MTSQVKVVKNSDCIRRMILTMLKKLSITEISQAQDDAETFNILNFGQIDLALLDCVMPGDDGFEILRKIRNDPELAALPEILVTGHADASVIANLEQSYLHANGIIAMRLSLNIPKARLETVLVRRSRTDNY